ncbi:MAG: serpin family protein [Tepidisphaeraceae bacterium]|jgi:serpin B
MNLPRPLLASAILLLLGLPAVSFAAGDDPDAALPQSINQFAFELYPHTGPPDANLIFSPFSIHLALEMTTAGAAGDTLTQMQSVLHLTADSTSASAGRLMDRLQSAGENSIPILKVASAIWAQQGVQWNPDFFQTVQTDFRGQAETVDFQDPSRARSTINDWVAAQTDGKILNLLPLDAIQPHVTKLILTNAVYFKGDWADPFEAARTATGPFHVPARTDPVQTAIMHQTSSLPYMETDSFQAIEMPYVGGSLSMLILLPKGLDGLSKLEANLNEKMLADVDQRSTPQRVAISLPKFKFRQTIDLVPALKILGMDKPFDPHQANFSGMDSSRDLYISGAVHQAYVEVNEEGTEAAAATGITMGITAMPAMPPEIFNADHPFLFLIRDRATGLVLFLGRVMNPLND